MRLLELIIFKTVNYNVFIVSATLDTRDKIENDAGTVTAFRELTEQQRQQILSK